VRTCCILPSKERWHLIYFDQRDMSTESNHWKKGGSHFHYSRECFVNYGMDEDVVASLAVGRPPKSAAVDCTSGTLRNPEDNGAVSDLSERAYSLRAAHGALDALSYRHGWWGAAGRHRKATTLKVLRIGHETLGLRPP